MRVYILDEKCKSLEQMLRWLSENKKVKEIKVFVDYMKLIEQVGKSPPDFCIIRLGKNKIPGLKAADMVQRVSSIVRILFISDESDYALDAYELGVYGYLLCPVEKEKLENYLVYEKKYS